MPVSCQQSQSVRFLSASLMLLACLGILTPLTLPAQEPARTLEFAGWQWGLKDSAEGLAGPGPNYFSNSEENAWVDEAGRLHLRITLRNGHWECAEVYSTQHVGYGHYLCILASPIDHLDPNAIFGFFTWDHDSHRSQANAEIDIEIGRFSKTAPNSSNLHYSLQPADGPDAPLGGYPERHYDKHFTLDTTSSTHTFAWTPTNVAWESYAGSGLFATPLATWEYNPHSRTASPRNGPGTEAILVPEPGPGTEVRLNLWLNRSRSPYYGEPIEVIIEDFRYIPLSTPPTP